MLPALVLALAGISIGAEASGSPSEPDLSCLRPEMGRASASTLVGDAMATLRRAGHDPAAYALELRSGGRASAVELVFSPRGDPRLYALAVRSDDPCAVRWLWQPERFTPWQRAVLERARELLAGSGTEAAGAEIVAVEVFEAPDAVTVELRRASGDDPAAGVSESRLTLLKRDVAAPAGAVPGGS